MKILATADLHLGRLPTWRGGGRQELSPEMMWSSLVEEAIGEDVSALVLSGDVVHHHRAYFNVLGALEEGLTRLASAGIPVVAVAGNHDVDLMARLSDQRKEGELVVLGSDGSWESATIVSRGGAKVDLWGTSFIREHSEENPLKNFDETRLLEGRPCLGVLHCDRDAQGPYAPVSSGDLERNPIQHWVLGHIHAPDPVPSSSERWALYPGSPLPFHPGEQGAHGPLLISLDEHSGRVLGVERKHLSPLRYESIGVELGNMDRQSELLDGVHRSLEDACFRYREEQANLTHLNLRLEVSFEGELELEKARDDLEEALVTTDPHMSFHGVVVQVNRLALAKRREVDFEIYRGQEGPLGVLAEFENSKMEEDETLQIFIKELRSTIEKDSSRLSKEFCPELDGEDLELIIQEEARRFALALLEQD